MSHTPPIEQQITFIYTKDIKQSAVFYERLLGLTLALDQGGCRIYKVCHNGFIGVCEREHAEAAPQGIILTLVSQDVDGWYEHLQEQGAALDKPPTHNPSYNIYHFFLRDPNGYLIEIQRFEDPRWKAGESME